MNKARISVLAGIIAFSLNVAADEHGMHGSVDDSLIEEQREALAENTEGRGSGRSRCATR